MESPKDAVDESCCRIGYSKPSFSNRNLFGFLTSRIKNHLFQGRLTSEVLFCGVIYTSNFQEPELETLIAKWENQMEELVVL